MNYIYDVLVNLNEELYDFYEWNINDEITHIRKIPVFKVRSKNLFEIKHNKIMIDQYMMEKIRNKTEMFSEREVKDLEYACLLSDGMDVVCITFNKNGVSTCKSKLLIDEEYEVIEVCERMAQTIFNYSIVELEIVDEYKTRKEIEIDKYVKGHINSLNKECNIDKLRYLYYECFDDKEYDKEKILNKIESELNNNWINIALKLYNFFKLTSINK